MNCIVCKNELKEETRIGKKFCTRHCANQYYYPRKVVISSKLTKEQLKIILQLQEDLLKEQKKQEIKDKIDKLNDELKNIK